MLTRKDIVYDCGVYDKLSGRRLFKASKFYSTKAELNRFARADGFTDFDDMKAFWIEQHSKKGECKSPFPYTGNLYKW